MANKPLKTIKFPGLDDTYTIPQKTSDLINDSGFLTSSDIDDTLTQSGKAADAKKTGDEISDLKEDLTSYADSTTMKNLIGSTQSEKYPVFLKSGTVVTASIASAVASNVRIFIYRKTGAQIDFYNIMAGNTSRTFTLPEDVYYVGYTCDSTVSNLQLEIGKSPTTYQEYSGSFVSTLTSLSEHGESIGGLQESLAGFYEPLYLKNLTDYQDFVASKYIKWDTGAETSSNLYRCSDYVPVMKGYLYGFLGVKNHFAFYDQNKQFAGTKTASDDVTLLNGGSGTNATIFGIRSFQYFVSPIDGYFRYSIESDIDTAKATFVALQSVQEMETLTAVPTYTDAEYKTVKRIKPLPAHLKICAWNVGLYSNGVESNPIPVDAISVIRKYFSAQNADILMITEGRPTINDSTENAQIYNYLYPYINDRGTVGGMELKSRYYMLNYGIGELTTGGRKYAYATININGIEVWIATVHLSPYADTRPSDITALLALMSQHEYFIVGGDYNAGNNDISPSADEYTAFLNEGYRLANCGYLGNFATNEGKYLDNIITSSNIYIANSYVETIENNPSDHLPIVGEFVICQPIQ